ncbi:MAG: NERD domain-containing protein, partial [Chloroflexota bacterium]
HLDSSEHAPRMQSIFRLRRHLTRRSRLLRRNSHICEAILLHSVCDKDRRSTVAVMIPAIPPAEGVSLAEQKVYHILADSLDDEYTVFHSFKAVSPNRDGHLLDTEIDFLLFRPGSGLLVLEVKGGPITFNGRQGRWLQGERPIRDPFDQATANKYKLKSYLAQRLGGAVQMPLMHAVCLPDTYEEPRSLPPNARRDILVTGRDLDDPPTALQRVYAAYKPPFRAASEKEADSLRQALMPLCEYGVSLIDRLEQAERQIFRLTEEQCRMLDFLRYQRTALIQGCAGSGKTVMAIKKARELAAEGQSILLLAFNRMIGERLKAAVADCPGIIAGTYHDYCIEQLTAADRLPSAEDENDYYAKAVPEAFLELVNERPVVFDALIVDEGQDFKTDFWISLSYLVRDDGHFYIFYDPDQNVFGSEMEFPVSGPPFILTCNCRNSQQICSFVARHTETEIRSLRELPEGEPVEDSVNTSATGRRRRLRRILEQLVNEQGLNPERIVLLGGHNIDKTCIPADGIIGDFRIVEGETSGRNVIAYYTYMKFKGCEADAVILVDVAPQDPRWSERAIYTTASRARHILYVVRSGEP